MKLPLRAGIALSLAWVALGDGGCSRGQPRRGDDPDVVAAANGSGSVEPLRAASPPSSRAEAQGPIAWKGSYSCAPGPLFVWDGGEWAGFKWRGDDASDGLGNGGISLAIDRETGRVTGTADGAIGNASLAGAFAQGRLTAEVHRKDPADRGLTGTLVAQQDGSALEGTMSLSAADAKLIREAHVSLTAGGP